MYDVNWIEVGKITEANGKTYRWVMCPHCGQVKLLGMDNKPITNITKNEVMNNENKRL